MAIHLVRHASAGRRGPGVEDLERPLDELGWAQAQLIASRLSGTAIVELYSSAALRCVQTLRPLSDETGLPIEVHPSLMEGQSAAAALELVDHLAATGRSAVLCSHGDIIPDVLDRLEHRGVPCIGTRCAKGSIWELEVRDGRVVGAAYETAAVS